LRVDEPDRRRPSRTGSSARNGGIYCPPTEPGPMSTPTKITLGTIGIAVLLAVASVLVLLS
jgi:hypothetical protein